MHAHKQVQCDTALLPSVSVTARGMFCGANYTRHTFTPIIKKTNYITTIANIGVKSYV